MEKYKINVNGKEYYVELELVDSNPFAGEVGKESTIKLSSNEAAIIVEAPLQGNVVNVAVTKNQKVNKGDVILVLEVMKMENDIVAICSGIISEIFVSEGQEVDVKTPLVTIREEK